MDTSFNGDNQFDEQSSGVTPIVNVRRMVTSPRKVTKRRTRSRSPIKKVRLCVKRKRTRSPSKSRKPKKRATKKSKTKSTPTKKVQRTRRTLRKKRKFVRINKNQLF